MQKLICFCIAVLSIAIFAPLALAADELLVIPTREGVTSSYWWMPRDKAKANLILMSGGSGGIGYREGAPQSGNFLIRSREYFATANPLATFNVALMGNSSDMRRLSEHDRASREHVRDMAVLIANIRKHNDLPIWLIGTSMGTVSAAVAAIELGGAIDGVILSSSYATFRSRYGLPKLDLEKIKIPVLVISHEKDTCKVTLPREMKYVMEKLENSKIKKLMIVSGGSEPKGDDCEAFHWHGFINMEAQAAQTMTNWILNPVP